MKVRHILPLMAMLMVATFAMAQIKIPHTNVSFRFPNGGWKYLKTITPKSSDAVIYLYSYDGKTIVDAAGDTVPPFMRVYVRRNYADSPFELAYERSLQQPFQSLSEYVDGLPGNDGIGYIGAYTSASDGKDYQFRMIYFKDQSSCIEIRLETTLDTFESMDGEFQDVLKSVKIGR
ncbi:MAG: hypothetical protein IJ620_05545 [Bacteroidales bacterium]|nr:hypothetical protein [Bacteroidales bacterium]